MSDQPLNIYVFHRSYFCGKVLAYLRYKGIPHNPVYKSLDEVGDKIIANTGLRQMPVIELPDGRWMNDTTPMIEWFEGEHPENAILTGDPLTDFFVRLLEDYADEWMWRSAILSRWQNKEDRRLYQGMFIEEFVGGFWAKAKPLTWIGGKLVHKHQRDKFLQGDGMTEQNREHVWAIYTDTLDRLEAIFQKQPYLLGDKPCMADFGFHGGMFWHFGNDPTPNRIMQERAPGVYEWVARLWNMTAEKAAGKNFNFMPGSAPKNWGPLLNDICEAYLPYLHTNAQAFAAGETRFDNVVQGYLYPGVHVSPYRVWCRERLQRHLNALSAEDQAKVRATLEPLGGWEPLTANPEITAQYDPENIAPFCKPRTIKPSVKKRMIQNGSNHIRTVRAWDQ